MTKIVEDTKRKIWNEIFWRRTHDKIAKRIKTRTRTRVNKTINRKQDWVTSTKGSHVLYRGKKCFGLLEALIKKRFAMSHSEISQSKKGLLPWQVEHILDYTKKLTMNLLHRHTVTGNHILSLYTINGSLYFHQYSNSFRCVHNRFDLIFEVLTPLLSTEFRLFRGGQFLLVEEAGVPGENHPTFVGKLTILDN